MSELETMRRDAELEAREDLGEFSDCPKCGCRSLVTTEHWYATTQDPACATGYCTCRKGEMLSDCCGYPENPDIEFCGNCREHTSWARDCEREYEFG